MNHKEIVSGLKGMAEEAMPANLDLWPTIQAQLEPPTTRFRDYRYRPVTRLGWIGLTIILLLMFSTVAYAISPILRQLFQTDPGLKHVEETDLVQPLHLSQTIAGVTIIVEQAYADANRITIGYTLEVPEGHHYKPRNLTLTWLPNTDLPPTIGHGDGTGGYNLSFDTTVIQDAPRQLDLQLAIYTEEFVYPPKFNKLLDQYGSVEKIPADQLLELPDPTTGDEVEPFIFKFTIPFLPSQTLSIQQTVEVGGIQVRLEEVSITPSQTEAIMCVTPPAEGEAFTDWNPITEIDTGQGAPLSVGAMTLFHQSDQEFCHRLIFPYALADQPGQWTMTVTELVGFHKTNVDKQMRPAGPWIFQFDVP